MQSSRASGSIKSAEDDDTMSAESTSAVPYPLFVSKSTLQSTYALTNLPGPSAFSNDGYDRASYSDRNDGQTDSIDRGRQNRKDLAREIDELYNTLSADNALVLEKEQHQLTKFQLEAEKRNHEQTMSQLEIEKANHEQSKSELAEMRQSLVKLPERVAELVTKQVASQFTVLSESLSEQVRSAVTERTSVLTKHTLASSTDPKTRMRNFFKKVPGKLDPMKTPIPKDQNPTGDVQDGSRDIADAPKLKLAQSNRASGHKKRFHLKRKEGKRV